jgi:hypothetical protein
MLSRCLAEDLSQSCAKALNIVALKRSELPQDQALLDRGENRFYQRRLGQPCDLPVDDQHLAKRSGGPKNLTRDSHDDRVRPPLVNASVLTMTAGRFFEAV